MLGYRSATHFGPAGWLLAALALDGCACGVSSHIAEDASVAWDAGPPEPRCRPPETLVERGDAAYDFDGDRCPDLILATPDHDRGRGALWLVRGAPAGAPALTLLAEGEIGEHLGEHVAYVDDLDGDGRRDLGVMRAHMGPGGPVFRGRWLGTAGATGPLGAAALPRGDVDDPFWSARMQGALDLDGDALPDPVIQWSRSCRGTTAGDTSAYLSTGGVIRLSDSGCGAAGPTRTGIVADVDGDLLSELVGYEGEHVRIRSARASQALDAPSTRLLMTRMGDVDGDGGDDVTFTSVDGTWLLRAGGGALRLDPSDENGSPIGDVDCDGYADGSREGLLVRGTPDGFMATDTSAVGRAGGRVDLDGDGCRDQTSIGAGVLAGRPGGAEVPAWELALPFEPEGRVEGIW